MLYHTLKQIFRSLWRHKSFTLINLLGLSLGIAAVLIIYLIADYEKSFDAFHSNSQQLYRVVSDINRADGVVSEATVPYPTARYLREQYPNIQASQIHYAEKVQVRLRNEAPFVQENVVFADSLFLKVLDFKGIEDFWLAGNPATALQGPGKAVLTAHTARRYFGAEDPIGKLIRLDNLPEVEVVGVVKDIPAATHLPFTMLISFASLNRDFFGGLNMDSWGFTGDGYTYVRLQDQAAAATAHEALQAVLEQNSNSRVATIEKMYLQPLSEIHFEPAFESSNPTYTISPAYLSMLLVLGAFIILIACVNYINLSTSLAFTKSKEVGIRKTIGASRLQLFSHYMLETFMLTFAAAVLGVLLALVLLPSVNAMLDKGISTEPMLKLPFLVGAGLMLLLITGISGAYPSLILAGFKPISVLKNQLSLPGKSSVVLRKSLVVFQFVISTALIICTLVIARQLEYFRSKELGFAKEAVVEVPLPESDSLKIQRFRAMLQNQAGIQQLSFCLGAPISNNGLKVDLLAPELAETSSYETAFLACDRNYLNTYGMDLLAGRWFLPSEEKNTGSAVVVNRTLINILGYTDPEEAIGKTIQLGMNRMKPTIVGVSEDFHTSSLHHDITPVVLTPFPYFYYAAGIRLEPKQMGHTLKVIEEAWKQVYPESVFEVNFVDETLQARYAQESRDYQLFQAFSLVSVFICCIGLWGLITFVVVRKTKEIGIRKVLGASVGGLVFLISRDFMKLIGLALLIASPIAWWGMERWLQDFAYRITLSWWIFVLAGILAILIAFITISYQAIKAAMTNPVKNLRTE